MQSSSSVALADSSAVPSSPSAAPFPLTPIERGWQHRTYSILREVLGPDFHGPSSSHTGAPQLIAREAHKALGAAPKKANVKLVNSFATTGDGHKTPIAVVAGLLGIGTTDPRTAIAVVIADQAGLAVEFEKVKDPNEHENTIEISLSNCTKGVFVKAISIGGGNFEILEKRVFSVAA